MCIQNVEKKQIAETDIICWKFGTISKDGGTFESLCHRFKYELKKPYKTDIVIKGTEGFQGFHTLQNESAILLIRSLDVVRCVIPKGATYYSGHYTTISGEIVPNYISDELIVVEKRDANGG